MKRSNVIDIQSHVGELKGFGPKKCESLEKLGIRTFYDALQHYPRGYEDLRNAKSIMEIADGEKALVRAAVLLARPGRGWGRRRTLRLLVEDATGRMEILFFSAGFMAKTFRQGELYRFFGKVKEENGRRTMFHPTWSPESGEEETGILPLYPLARGLTQKDMRRLTRTALALSEGMPETLPESVIEAANLCSIHYALSNLHYPEDEDKFSEARYRLVYEELFDLRAALILSQNRFGTGREGRVIRSGGADKLVSSLPYELTSAQNRVLSDVLADMASQKAMNRLVQGDVGSGKTAIAMAAMAEAAAAGLQSAFMAPTEILAKQHYDNLRRAFEPLGMEVVLLIAGMGAAQRRAALEKLSSGEALIAVGTHALLTDTVIYRDLALVITDEQHRFGVGQRKKLEEKGEDPDVLIMTATPIPRTLAVVLYADLDISIIDELPPGRQTIETKRFSPEHRKDAYKELLNEVGKGRQAYIVAPFIDDSDSLEGWSAESLLDEFTKDHPTISCGLLHGQMNQKEKDAVMERFHAGEIAVLISTVVIEVGIDVPNATVMLIENAERFGLAQLHQLRGRVGRGTEKSFCLLIVDMENEIAVERVDTLCKTRDGFVIAEKDLELRGPGEIFGSRQHGLPQLRLADPARHLRIAERAGADAAALIADDPSLEKLENAAFARKIRNKFMEADKLIL